MRRVILLCAVLVAAACEKHRTVDLTLGEDLSGAAGFACVDGSGVPLLRRADVGGTVDAALVFDYLRLKRDPGCRGSQVYAYCRSGAGNCQVIPSQRVCVPFPAAPFPASGTSPQLAAAFATLTEAAIGGMVVTSDAPDDVVIVRIVGVGGPGASQSCPSLLTNPLPEIPPADTLGVAYSCPVHLDSAPNPLYLGFDAITTSCESVVTTVSANAL